MDSERVDISVLTPILDEEAYVAEAARDMLAQRFEGNVEFLFIDGHSTDRTAEILAELAEKDPRIRVLDNPARITPVSLNIGLRAARGEVVARMDAHTQYPPDYLARGVERLRQGAAAHVSGPQIARGRGKWSRRVAMALSTRLGTGGADFRHTGDAEFEVDSGFTGMWLRSTLEEQGGWDEGWWNDQDMELAARIRKAGGRIVCLPEMAADYIPRDSLRALARQYWRYGFYRAKTSRRHPESMRRSHLLAPGLVLALVLALVLRGRAALLPRAGVVAWLAAVIGVSAGQAEPGRRGDAAALPLVFATMHLCWGAGFIAGSASWGPPWRAVLKLAAGSWQLAAAGRESSASCPPPAANPER
jgi:succinoglycan biosynthesis protein ExoA